MDFDFNSREEFSLKSVASHEEKKKGVDISFTATQK